MSSRFFQRFSAAFCVFAFIAFQAPLFSAPAKSGRSSASKPAPAPATYKGAIVIDAAGGAVLFEDNADVVNPPASVTKLMTFLLVEEAVRAGKISLSTPTNVTRDEARFAMKRGSTSVWLNEKESYSVEELLYAMMIRSANDAALVLSRTIAGSSQAFVGRMNERARELGMTNTRFVTPHGLSPSTLPVSQGDLSSPRDLAILSRHLVNNTDIIKYTSVRTRNFGEGQRKEPVIMTNHNHLLGKVAGVDGLKTGYTDGAGFCLAATAERNGNRIIAVTMGTPNRLARDAKIAELIETAFARLPAKPATPVSPVSPVSPVTPVTNITPASSAAPAPAKTTPAPAMPTPAPAIQPIFVPEPASAPATTAPSPSATIAPSATPAPAPAPAQSLDIPDIVFPVPGGSGGAKKK